MSIEIRETIVTPAVDGNVVQLRISDVPLGDESATFVLNIQAKLPLVQTPTLAHLQRAAMDLAQDALTPLLQKLAAQLQQAGYELRLRPA